jgi:Mn2+/Fe2+ NRAMP family transporter
VSARQAKARTPSKAPTPAKGSAGLWGWARALGPGLVTGAADDDPSGIATYSQAGAQFGFALLWTVFLTLPLMIAIQLISAQIGRVTGRGIIANVKAFYPMPLVNVLVVLLLAANTFNIGADLAAMGDALVLVIGGRGELYAVAFGIISVILEVLVSYRFYAPILKWLTLVLFLYVATALTVHIPWRAALFATVWPHVTLSADYLLMIVAIFGTTISPYLFFWQASQEVEEMQRGRPSPPLKSLARGGKVELDRMALDTSVGMVLSNVIAYFIILTTAATLNAHGVTDIHTAADAANALRPLAGDLTFFLFALGIIGTGLLAVPVLAGSAAYAISDAWGWRATLEARPRDAMGFYGLIAGATLIGLGLTLAHIDPIHMLIWSAVLNGIVAVPVMAVMMVVSSNAAVMKTFRVRGSLLLVGWLATGVMAVAAAAFLWSLV